MSGAKSVQAKWRKAERHVKWMENITPEQRDKIRESGRKATAKYRANLAGKKLEEYREKARKRQREWWANATQEEKQKQREFKDKYIQKLTPEQKKRKAVARRERYLKKLASMTAEQIEDMKKKEREYKRKRYPNLTEEQKEKRRAYARNRRATDIQFRLQMNLRGRLCAAIKNKQKKGSAIRDLGCTIKEFMDYIALKFKDGMTWENWGKAWELDHIIPISYFDLTNRDELLKAVHYTNYQPLTCEENSRKSDFVILPDGTRKRLKERWRKKCES